MLTKDAILAAEDLPREKVTVPEWGGDFFLRGMTGAERDEFDLAQSDLRKAGKVRNVRAALLVRTICDEHGKRVFEDADASFLGGKSGAVLDRLFDVAARLSGVGMKAEETLAKNLNGRGGDSSSS